MRVQVPAPPFVIWCNSPAKIQENRHPDKILFWLFFALHTNLELDDPSDSQSLSLRNHHLDTLKPPRPTHRASGTPRRCRISPLLSASPSRADYRTLIGAQYAATANAITSSTLSIASRKYTSPTCPPRRNGTRSRPLKTKAPPDPTPPTSPPLPPRRRHQDESLTTKKARTVMYVTPSTSKPFTST